MDCLLYVNALAVNDSAIVYKCAFCDAQELKEACRNLVRLEPMLHVYSELVRWYVAVCMGAHRSTGKLLSVLAGVFTDLAQKVASGGGNETSPV